MSIDSPNRPCAPPWSSGADRGAGYIHFASLQDGGAAGSAPAIHHLDPAAEDQRAGLSTARPYDQGAARGDGDAAAGLARIDEQRGVEVISRKPPLLICVPDTMPWGSSSRMPPDSTIVSRAVPIESTCTMAPLLTTKLERVAPDSISRMPPGEIVVPLCIAPLNSSNVPRSSQ